MRPFLSQWRAEFSLAMRQGEQLLVSVGIPLGILVFFSQIDVVRFDGVDAVDYLTPATMALAVMSTSMVSLGIGTGFDRNYGVLKRLGSTPLGRGRWLAAKVATVATIEVGQVAVLAMVGAALGWRPPPTWPLGLVARHRSFCRDRVGSRRTSARPGQPCSDQQPVSGAVAHRGHGRPDRQVPCAACSGRTRSSRSSAGRPDRDHDGSRELRHRLALGRAGRMGHHRATRSRPYVPLGRLKRRPSGLASRPGRPGLPAAPSSGSAAGR